ncbi:MAG: GtrA family protein [Clostridia bacterium]|nr:GtrA family protein [Clostridia bacterium]
MKDKGQLLQALKFTLFSLSAGIIQIGSFAVLEIFIKDYWIPYLISLILSIVWNFTLNRRYTFKSAANIPVAMAKVFGFYLVFTPVSTWLGDLAEQNGGQDFVILIVTMVANFVLEYLFCKFVVYRGQENTIEEKSKE